MKRQTADLSGFGGFYEWGMQTMLEAGMKWLEGRDSFPVFYSFKNIYGLIVEDSAEAKELSTAISSSVNSEQTGVMHQCVIQHLAYIHANGYDKWLLIFEPERLFSFDGTVASCPVTALSKRMDEK